MKSRNHSTPPRLPQPPAGPPAAEETVAGEAEAGTAVAVEPIPDIPDMDAPAEPPADAEGGGEAWGDVASLEAQLQEKEQLVQALTNRLEQAAEQLDRVHRTGGDRRAHIGGFPPELIAQQKELVDELQRVVQSWEDMQAALTLGRIETQVVELRDLVANRLTGGGPAVGVRQEASKSSESVIESLRGLRRPKEDAAPAVGWEAMKASMLQGDAPAAEASLAAEAPAAEAPAAFSDAPEEPLELEGAPAPIDPAAATIEELRQAVDLRDAFIAQLARNLRRLNVRRRVPEDWSVLAGVPEELVENVRNLEQQLDANQRLAEVELSLERAKLGREEMRLREWEERLEKEAARRVPAGKEAEEPDSAKGRRWLRMLGMNNKNGQEG